LAGRLDERRVFDFLLILLLALDGRPWRGLDAHVREAKRESHLRGDASVLVRQLTQRLRDVDANLGGAERYVCQQFKETAIVVFYLDSKTPTRRCDRRVGGAAEATGEVVNKTKHFFVLADENDRYVHRRRLV